MSLYKGSKVNGFSGTYELFVLFLETNLYKIPGTTSIYRCFKSLAYPRFPKAFLFFSCVDGSSLEWLYQYKEHVFSIESGNNAKCFNLVELSQKNFWLAIVSLPGFVVTKQYF